MRREGSEQVREKIDKKKKKIEKGLEARGKFQLTPWTQMCQTAKQ